MAFIILKFWKPISKIKGLSELALYVFFIFEKCKIYWYVLMNSVGLSAFSYNISCYLTVFIPASLYDGSSYLLA